MTTKLGEEIEQRLREFLVEKFGSINEGARALGKEPSAIRSSYLAGNSIPGGEFLVKLTEVGCDIYWLLTGLKQPLEWVAKERGVSYIAIDEALDKHDIFVEYPILANVPAGKSEIKEHDWPEYIKLDLDPREYFALRIDEEYGVSMSPFIEPGDLIFCSIKQKFNNGDIVVARYDSTKGAIKRIFIHNQITLISFNPTEHPIVINKKQLEQVYKVVLIWKKR